MRLGRGSISVLGTRTYPWNDPRNMGSRLDLERAMARMDNRKCEICGAVGAECDRHTPKQGKRKYESYSNDGIRWYIKH